MRHFKQLGLFIIIAFLAWSCAERTICPAYQSAFIHDKDALAKHFSYFKEDSTPKLLSASKDRFGIAEKQPYWKKVRSLNTVEVRTIYPQIHDSTQLAGDIIQQAEMDIVDSVALDSSAVNEIGWTEHFNVDQEFYFYYFNEILVYPEERAIQAAADEQRDKIKKDQGERTGEKQNFFQKLFSKFKKKPKSEDGISELTDQTGNDEQEVDGPPKKKKKKFGFGKKKRNEKIVEEDKQEEEVPEEEDDEDDEDDDF